MPEMNENVSSGGADQGLERNGAATEAAALLRTAASALLSAAEIWTTNDVTRPSAPAVAAAETAPAEVTSLPQPAIPHKLRPSEVLAEARFFSLQVKRAQDGQSTPPPLPSEVS